jgi:hypothetical protein
MGESTAAGFKLESPAIKVFEKKAKESGKNNLNIYLNRPMIKAWDQVGIVTYVESGHS